MDPLTGYRAAYRSMQDSGYFFLITVVAAMLALPQHAVAAEWLVTPNLDLKETHTDNVRLAPRGSERSDWITQIDPGISLIGNGSRLKFNANYQMQNFLYAKDSRAHTLNHLLNADTNAKLVDEFLFLDGKAAISQQNISALGALAVDNANLTNNRTTVRSYSISPYLRHNFHEIASSELRYTHDAVETTIFGLANRQSDGALFNLESGSAFKTLGWGLDYNKQRTNYNGHTQTVGSAGSEAYSGNLRYQITARFALKITGGHEKFDYPSTGQKPEGSTRTAGFAWAPTERTNIEASAGRRYFGDTYMLNASHRTLRTVWNLGYNEDITTTQSQFLVPATINTATFLNNLWSASIPDPALRQQTVDTFIRNMGLPPSLADPVNYLSNRVFLQKRLQASVAVTGAKNTIMLSIFGMSRKAQTSAIMDSALLGTNNFASSDNTRQIGGNVLWNCRVSSRTNVSISADASSTAKQSYLKSLKAGISRQLQPKLGASIDLRRVLQHSDQTGIGYQENAITASLLMQF